MAQLPDNAEDIIDKLSEEDVQRLSTRWRLVLPECKEKYIALAALNRIFGLRRSGRTDPTSPAVARQIKIALIARRRAIQNPTPRDPVPPDVATKPPLPPPPVYPDPGQPPPLE